MPRKILFISKGENASSTRYRALQYFPYFLTEGFQPKHISISGGLLPILMTLIAIKNSDVIILLRKTFPWPVFWLIRRLSKKLVFDFDDAIFCNTNGTYSKTRMERFKSTIEKCDYVFAGNEYLANEALKFNPNTVVIPTSVNAKKYELNPPKNNNSIILVWIGSQSTKKYLVEILPSLEKAALTIPNLKLKVIADFSLSSDILSIENITWDETTEADELCKSHIGIAPLPTDDWTKGKCALKVLQYMAAGLPVVSSASGMNPEVVDHGNTGWLIQDNTQWDKLLIDISADKSHLIFMGEMGRARVNSEFTIEVIFKKILVQLAKLY